MKGALAIGFKSTSCATDSSVHRRYWIVEDMEVAPEQFRLIAGNVGAPPPAAGADAA